MEKFPCTKQSEGYTLFVKDFEKLHPGKSFSLLKWNDFKTKLLELYDKRNITFEINGMICVTCNKIYFNLTYF